MESDSGELRREADARVGTTLLDKWRLDALIGLGGMAAVFAATHRNGLRGALKILWANCSCDEDIRRRFLLEGYIANRVDHPGAVRVLDDDVTPDGRAFLVMELLDGNSLQVLAESQGGCLDAARVLTVTDQVLDVLAAAHDEGIVHRDIKPENLFLTVEGQVKLLDFGIARLNERKPHALRATQSGAPMGTPGFMAPEQARGRWDLVGPRSDLWSVGATMFALLTGATVHEGDTTAEIVAAAFTKPARSLAAAMSHAPKPLVAVVDRALLLDPASRWSDARAMQAAVRATYLELFGNPLPAVVAPVPMLHAQRHWSVGPMTASVDRSYRPRPEHNKFRRGRSIAIGAALAAAALLAVAHTPSAAKGASPPAFAVNAENTIRTGSLEDAPPEDRPQEANVVEAPVDVYLPGFLVEDHPPQAVEAPPPKRTALASALSGPATPVAKAAHGPRPVAMVATAQSTTAPLSSRSAPDLKALFDRRL